MVILAGAGIKGIGDVQFRNDGHVRHGRNDQISRTAVFRCEGDIVRRIAAASAPVHIAVCQACLEAGVQHVFRTQFGTENACLVRIGEIRVFRTVSRRDDQVGKVAVKQAGIEFEFADAEKTVVKGCTQLTEGKTYDASFNVMTKYGTTEEVAKAVLDAFLKNNEGLKARLDGNAYPADEA